MTRTVIRSKLGKDGVLHLDVPFGASEASIDVDVTVEPVAKERLMTHEEWLAFLNRTAGAWQGEFIRPEQGEFETRDPL